MRESLSERRPHGTRSTFTAVGVCLLACLLGGWDFKSGPPSVAAQEQPTLRTFGESVKRLKWDPVRQEAVDAPSLETRTTKFGEDVIRIDTELVVCDLLIRDAQGRLVETLAQDDFVLSEDGRPQNISHFSRGNPGDVDRTIVLIIDYSASQSPYIHNSTEAAKILVNNLGPKDRMAIVTDDVELKVDFTTNKAALKNALDDLKDRALVQRKFGRSEQFTALMATVRELFSSEDFRRIVIFQTDGDEFFLLQPPDLYGYTSVPRPHAGASEKEKRKAEEKVTKALSKLRPARPVREFGLGDIHTAAEKSRATIYSVIPGYRLAGVLEDDLLRSARNHFEAFLPGQGDKPSESFPNKLLLQAAEPWAKFQRAVSSVSEKTGGFTQFLERPDQANDIYSYILSDLNRRYVIGYYPTNKTRDGKRRSVSIEVRNHPEYVVEGRKAYYAPSPEQ